MSSLLAMVTTAGDDSGGSSGCDRTLTDDRQSTTSFREYAGNDQTETT